jgi:hypothetical protein
MAGLQRTFAPGCIDDTGVNRLLLRQAILQIAMRRDERGLRIVCHSNGFLPFDGRKPAENQGALIRRKNCLRYFIGSEIFEWSDCKYPEFNATRFGGFFFC